MRLSTRLTLFFLAAQAIVLIGFSVSLHVLASKYLHRQDDERLEAAINTLVAAAEVGPDGVEWEPEERRLTFGRRTVEGSFAWLITDLAGRRLDGSSPAGSATFLGESSASSAPTGRAHQIVDQSGGAWQVMDRRLEPNPHEKMRSRVEIDPKEGRGKHEALVIRAGISLDGVRGTLRNLALVLVVLSSGLFTLALVFGRRLSRRALRPVTQMAEAAHSIGGHDLDERLPTPESGDELEELGRSFNGLLGRLRESFVRQNQFTGDASHQLRTPLTAMQGQVDLALRQERSVEEYRRVLSLVQRKTRRLRQIVESLLFLARADAEVPQPQLEPTDLVAWLPGHLESWHDPRAASDLRLLNGTGGPIWARVQPVLLGELVNNLLDNASKYSEPGTPIIVRLVQEAGTARLSVADHGVGINEADIPHVFEAFYRSPQARSRGSAGLGLGLSMAARLARSFGGSIEVESDSRTGSIFTVRFPTESLPNSPAEAQVMSGTTDLAGVT
ncbi:MAG: ATP-binding protein [Isosphaerales bacterium]